MFVATLLGVAGGARASNPALDRASDSAYNSGWSNGLNGGSGFGAWQLSGSGNAGFFIGNSASNGDGNGDINSPSSTKAFGMYGNSGGVASAVRPFTGGALSTSQSFAIHLDNGYIDNGSAVGLGLQNSSGTNRIEFYFVGGGNFYRINPIAASPFDTTVGFTDDGLRLQFSPKNATQIEVTVRNTSGSQLFNQLVTVANASDISQVRLFNANAGGGGQRDAFFNELAVPEPGLGALVLGSALVLLRRR